MKKGTLIDCFYKFFVKKDNYTSKDYINLLKGLDILANELINQYQINDYIHETQKEDAIDMLITELSNPDGKVMRRLRELFFTKVGNTEVIKEEQYNPLFFYLKKVLFTCLKQCATDAGKDRIRFSKSVKDKLEILVGKGIVYVFNESSRADLITYSSNPNAEKKGVKIVKQGLIINFKRKHIVKKSVNYELKESIITLLCAEANRNYLWNVNDIVSALYNPGKDVQFSSVTDDESDCSSSEEVILNDYHRNNKFEEELKHDEIDFKNDFADLFPKNWIRFYLEDKDSEKKRQMVREQFIAKLAGIIIKDPNRLKLCRVLPEHYALLEIEKLIYEKENSIGYKGNLGNITKKIQNFLNVVLYNNYSLIEEEKTVKRTTSYNRYNEFDNEVKIIMESFVGKETLDYYYSVYDRFVEECIDNKVFPELVTFYERIVKKGEK